MTWRGRAGRCKEVNRPKTRSGSPPTAAADDDDGSVQHDGRSNNRSRAPAVPRRFRGRRNRGLLGSHANDHRSKKAHHRFFFASLLLANIIAARVIIIILQRRRSTATQQDDAIITRQSFDARHAGRRSAGSSRPTPAFLFTPACLPIAQQDPCVLA